MFERWKGRHRHPNVRRRVASFAALALVATGLTMLVSSPASAAGNCAGSPVQYCLPGNGEVDWSLLSSSTSNEVNVSYTDDGQGPWNFNLFRGGQAKATHDGACNYSFTATDSATGDPVQSGSFQDSSSCGPTVTQPTASFTDSVRGKVASFNASGSDNGGGTLTYSWNFGDGTTGSGVSPSHTYPTLTADKTYHVKLTVTNSAGSDSVTHDVTITGTPPVQKPSVNLSISKTEITAGDAAPTLSWTSQNTTSLTASGAWSGSKAVPSGNEAVPSSDANTPGTYTFTLTTNSNSAGQGTDSVTLQVDKPQPPPPSKVYVCKYVGKPGVDERLQTGQNPIDVSVNAIPENPVQVGSYFADAQGRSYVLAFDTGQPAPSVNDCPAPQGPPPPPTTKTVHVKVTATPCPGDQCTVSATIKLTGVTQDWVNQYDATIPVTLSDGSTVNATLVSFSNGTATYTVATHGKAITDATAVVPDNWCTCGGSFTVTEYQCKPKPVVVTPAAPTATTPDCTTQTETVTPSDQTGVVWTPAGSTTLQPGGDSVTYTAAPAQGYVFPKGAQTSWTFTNNFDVNSCLQSVTPLQPMHTTPDCTSQTETVYPVEQTGVVWSPLDSTGLAPGESVTYTASPAEGYKFPEGAQTSWTFSNNLDVSKCVPPPPPHKQVVWVSIALLGAPCGPVANETGKVTYDHSKVSVVVTVAGKVVGDSFTVPSGRVWSVVATVKDTSKYVFPNGKASESFSGKNTQKPFKCPVPPKHHKPHPPTPPVHHHPVPPTPPAPPSVPGSPVGPIPHTGFTGIMTPPVSHAFAWMRPTGLGFLGAGVLLGFALFLRRKSDDGEASEA